MAAKFLAAFQLNSLRLLPVHGHRNDRCAHDEVGRLPNNPYDRHEVPFHVRNLGHAHDLRMNEPACIGLGWLRLLRLNEHRNDHYEGDVGGHRGCNRHGRHGVSLYVRSLVREYVPGAR